MGRGPPKTDRKYLKYPQIIELGKRIEAVCTLGEDNYAHYQEGWNDQRIAREMGPPVGLLNVSHLRLQLIGPLKHPGVGGRPPGIADLRAMVDALVEWASQRTREPFLPPETDAAE